MEMTDHILFVKETKTCAYVLVLHTPRLCGEPGFKSRRDAAGEAEIRCREVVDTRPEGGQLNLPAADHPVKFPLRKTVLPAPQPGKGDKKNGADSTAKEKLFNNILRKTLEALVSSDGGGSGITVGEDGDYIIEVPDDAASPLENDRLMAALREAGYDVRTEFIDLGKLKDKLESDKTKTKQAPPQQDRKRKEPPARKHQPDPHRDEL
jgi:protein OS-9